MNTDIPKCLPNIERIYSKYGYLHQISPFIRSAANLEAIKVTNSGFSGDLMELNRERERLDDAKKVTIYVNEYFYVHKNGRISQRNSRK